MEGQFQRHKILGRQEIKDKAKEMGEGHTFPHPEPRALQEDSRCGGMIFTLISLVVLGVVLRGLYFFSAGGAASPGAAVALQKRNSQQPPQLSLFSEGPLHRNLNQSSYLCRLRGMGFRLYLSDTITVLELFFTGTKDGVSSSSPGEKHVDGSSTLTLTVPPCCPPRWSSLAFLLPHSLKLQSNYWLHTLMAPQSLTSGTELGVTGCRGSQ